MRDDRHNLIDAAGSDYAGALPVPIRVSDSGTDSRAYAARDHQPGLYAVRLQYERWKRF